MNNQRLEREATNIEGTVSELISYIDGLEELIDEKNDSIDDLEKQIEELKNLSILIIDNNPINELPESMLELNLSLLKLRDCPIKEDDQVLKELINRGTIVRRDKLRID